MKRGGRRPHRTLHTGSTAMFGDDLFAHENPDRYAAAICIRVRPDCLLCGYSVGESCRLSMLRNASLTRITASPAITKSQVDTGGLNPASGTALTTCAR